MPKPIDALLELVATLRHPVDGCSWDLAQTHSSLCPFAIEEAYEVVDAIENGTPDQLRDELGDLLFQVVLHSRIAEEEEHFNFSDVARSVGDKMVRRHPHVFARQDIGTVQPSWEELKRQERWEAGSHDTSAISGVGAGVPELVKAVKLQTKAAKTGFDWNDPLLVIDKVKEELSEVEAELGPSVPGVAPAGDRLVEEVGDVLFACVNLARQLQVDPAAALRVANGKFERRFREMERIAGQRGLHFAELSLSDQEGLWQLAKKAETPSS